MGPMITEREAEQVEQWVNEAKKIGASILCGGKEIEAVMEPTALENVPETATIL